MFVKSVLTLTDSLTDSLTASLLERPVTLKISCAGITDKKYIKTKKRREKEKKYKMLPSAGRCMFPEPFLSTTAVNLFYQIGL